MRVLLFASWHHFAFIVISIALLGFGASGTVLSFLREWLFRRSETAMFAFILVTAISMPLSISIVQHIPVEARFVPALLPRQIGLWILYWAVLFVPFLAGASAIGFSLMTAHNRLPTIYGANLAGGALGALIAPIVMHWVEPVWLATVMGGITITALPQFAGKESHTRRIGMGIAITSVAILLWLAPPQIRFDPFKFQSHVNRLVEDNRAVQVAVSYGPRSVVNVYASDTFHEMAFLSVGQTPPPMFAITIDGHWAGSILRIDRAHDARVVDNTLMAVPYTFVRSQPRVLLLGETGGANVWLASRRNATSIRVVQPNTEVVTVFDELILKTERGGRVLELPAVTATIDDPRHYVAHTRDRFDLLHLSAFESWGVATGGVAGLQQDNLMTVEGLSECLEILASDAVLSVCRAIQLPPRDNIKLLATAVDAMRKTGIESPQQHTVIVRDYLAVCTMIKKSPWTLDEIEKVRETCRLRELTPVFFAGIRGDELNHPDRLPGPYEQPGDWLHYAATEVLSSRTTELIDRWPFDIRPPTDDRPFFANYAKLKSIRTLRDSYGDLWLTRTELAFLFVLAAMGIIVIIGALLTMLPLILIRDIRHGPGCGSTAIYFSAIGLAYLVIEVIVLSRMIHLIGDPVQAGAVTIAGFLFFSGMGSLTAQTTGAKRARTTRLIFGLLIMAGVLEWWLVDWALSISGALNTAWRIIIALLVISPLAFLMGFPMPTGLSRVETNTPVLVPWAWGVNGFASVLAPPLATAIGMTRGFRVAGVLALALYVIAALLFSRLPQRDQTNHIVKGNSSW